MTVPPEQVELIQGLFREVDPTITVARGHYRHLQHYTFEVLRGGHWYEFTCPRPPVDDGNIKVLRRLRDQFMLSHPEWPSDTS